MKRLFLLFILTATSVAAGAQNVQLHYDFGRGCATSTVEMFRPDGGGSTYFFVDMDYTPKVSGAYFEISRELCFWQDSRVNWLSAHVEFNGGLDTAAGSFNNAWLAGATYSGHSKDFSKTWSLTASYMQQHESHSEHSVTISNAILQALSLKDLQFTSKKSSSSDALHGIGLSSVKEILGNHQIPLYVQLDPDSPCISFSFSYTTKERTL